MRAALGGHAGLHGPWPSGLVARSCLSVACEALQLRTRCLSGELMTLEGTDGYEPHRWGCNGRATVSLRRGRPASGKGPRTRSWAFSGGKQPQRAGKPGRRPAPQDRGKALQIVMTQEQLHTTEDRGVPGSSPGLAICRPRSRIVVESRVSRCNGSRRVGAHVAPSWSLEFESTRHMPANPWYSWHSETARRLGSRRPRVVVSDCVS